MTTYNVKLQKFEGPFELLLGLIDERKLSITEISLAEVSDQYLSYLKDIGGFPINEAASFIVTAATLMLIKSRSLLPAIELSPDEEIEIHDLEERLRLYKKYKELANELGKIFGKNVIFGREPFAQLPEIFIEPQGLTTDFLTKALESIFENIPKKEVLPTAAVKKTVTLEQRIEEMINRLKEKMNFCFSEISQTKGCEKIDVIVNFLAILELVKRGFILVKQSQGFGEIEINKLI